MTLGCTRAVVVLVVLARRGGDAPVSVAWYGAGHTAYLVGRPARRQDVVVLADDERIGVTLATEIAQRVAALWHWPRAAH